MRLIKLHPFSGKMCIRDRVTRGGTERPRGALLYPDIGSRYVMYRIGGRRRRCGVSCAGAVVGIPPLMYWGSNREFWNGPRDIVRWAV